MFLDEAALNTTPFRSAHSGSTSSHTPPSALKGDFCDTVERGSNMPPLILLLLALLVCALAQSDVSSGRESSVRKETYPVPSSSRASSCTCRVFEKEYSQGNKMSL